MTEQEQKLALNMLSITPKKWKQLLYRDECGDDFLLTKSGEVYRYSETECRAILWSRGRAARMQKLALYPTKRTDDHLYLINFRKDDLEAAISILGAFKKRPWRRLLVDKEAKLAHKILPYRPVVFT